MSEEKIGMDLVLEQIKRERQRQVMVEGYKRAHDDEHSQGEIAKAAAAYALRAACQNDAAHDLWPWNDESWRPKDARSDLIRAGALIVAEVERIDRAAGSASVGAARG